MYFELRWCAQNQHKVVKLPWTWVMELYFRDEHIFRKVHSAMASYGIAVLHVALANELVC